MLFCMLLAVLVAITSCNKDSELNQVEAPELTEQQEWADQAQALLDQLPAEERELLSTEDVQEFMEGPNEQKINLRSGFTVNRSWRAMLAFFNMEVSNGITAGKGPWLGTGISQFEIDHMADMTNGFSDGRATMTDGQGQKMMGDFNAGNARTMSNGMVRQTLIWTLDKGTGFYFKPEGQIVLQVIIRPDRAYPIMVIARGWAFYGLNVDPVPRAFEEHFPVDFLEQHYLSLENVPGARPMYITTQNDFWGYPTAQQFTTAAPGIGTGQWNGEDVTFVVDQTMVGDLVNDPASVTSSGKYRIYMAPLESLQDGPIPGILPYSHTYTNRWCMAV